MGKQHLTNASNHRGAGFLISFSYKQKTPDGDSGVVGRDMKCTCSSRA